MRGQGREVRVGARSQGRRASTTRARARGRGRACLEALHEPGVVLARVQEVLHVHRLAAWGRGAERSGAAHVLSPATERRGWASGSGTEAPLKTIRLCGRPVSRQARMCYSSTSFQLYQGSYHLPVWKAT